MEEILYSIGKLFKYILDYYNYYYLNRCPDLEVYSKEVNPQKLNFLLINKSDLLSNEIRAEWS